MTEFHYKAKALSGEIITGTYQANNENELAKLLLKENYILISAESKERKKKDEGIRINIGFGKRVSLVEKMMFTRYLSVMLEAGFPFDRSLLILAKQARNKNFKKIILEMMDDVVKGESFSSSLQRYPTVFDELYTNMVKIGEEAGNLNEVLNILASQMEKDYKLLAKVRGAMIYPAIIFIVMILIGIAVMIMVIPQFSAMFKMMGVELPFTTRIIITIGDFMKSYWYLIPIATFVLILGTRELKKTKSGRKTFDWASLHFPVLGPLSKKFNTARTSRILGSLLKSGVPIVKSLEIISNTLTNIYYKNAMSYVSQDIQKGRSLKECLAPYGKIYSFLLIQMIEVGEKTGKLSEILERLADFYEQEVDNAAKDLSSIIEPFLMIVIGIAVGVFAVSVIQPLYSMMGAL